MFTGLTLLINETKDFDTEWKELKGLGDEEEIWTARSTKARTE